VSKKRVSVRDKSMDCGVSRDACEDVVSVQEEGRGVVFGTGYR